MPQPRFLPLIWNNTAETIQEQTVVFYLLYNLHEESEIPIMPIGSTFSLWYACQDCFEYLLFTDLFFSTIIHSFAAYT